MLTKKQRDLLIFINDYIQKTGLSPSFEEMKLGLDLKSKSGIHRLINALVERGFLERLPNKARALEVKKLPENVVSLQAQQAANAGGGSRRAPAGAGNLRPSYGHAIAGELVQLPIHGKIAAGTPIEAVRQEVDTIGVPMSMLGMQPCYALSIEGDSMIKAGIMDGDIVIIEKCDRANDGDIVVALVNEEEVTLKRLRREVGQVVLMPENDAYQPIRLPPQAVRIQGRLRSLFRNY
ncbi:MAG TPA: transcriptional repressor LexA [Patescibacteria group bacterium]|nr:transcriptional repressor LexA [Patescibacteria group bacterium]